MVRPGDVLGAEFLVPLGCSAEFWLRLQVLHDLEAAGYVRPVRVCGGA